MGKHCKHFGMEMYFWENVVTTGDFFVLKTGQVMDQWEFLNFFYKPQKTQISFFTAYTEQICKVD